MHAAEKLIAERLVAAGMYRNPQVTLQLTESPNQVATVTGELHSVVPVVGQRRLFDVLATAGGLPATASHMVTIQWPGIDHPIVVDLGTAFAMSFGADSWSAPARRLLPESTWKKARSWDLDRWQLATSKPGRCMPEFRQSRSSRDDAQTTQRHLTSPRTPSRAT